MRIAFVALLAALLGVAIGPEPSLAAGKRSQANSAPAPSYLRGPAPEFASADAMLAWIDRYHLEPTPERLPDAVRQMVRLGLLKDPEKSGLFVGFLAGALGASPVTAEKLIVKMFPMPPEDQGALILAVAYSDLPDWRGIATRNLAERMPARQALLRKHIYEPHVPLLKIPLNSGTETLDMLWGFYLATEKTEAVVRIISALPWSKEKKDVLKLTIGGVAKWTLATNASRDKAVLDTLRRALPTQPKDAAEILREVIKSAENFETHKIRKEMVDAIEDLKRRGPQPDGVWAKAANVGSVAIAVGCIAASVTGHVELGVPCIITGAVASGAAKLLGP
jgi:hypothetical protein